MKRFFYILFHLGWLLPTTAQFNTLSYTTPTVERAETITIVDSLNEKKETKKLKKRKRVSKAELKKDLDSLKSLVLQMNRLNQNKSINSVEPTMIEYEKIKKYEFIKAPKIVEKIHMPIEKKLVITSPFGVRKHPISGKVKMHNGVDFRANHEAVYSVLDGIVSVNGWDKNGGGNYIKIKHSEKFETAYLHLDKIYYKQGDVVKAGDIIAISGNSGSSTAPHLHFAVKENGKFINPVQFLNELIEINNLIATYYE